LNLSEKRPFFGLQLDIFCFLVAFCLVVLCSAQLSLHSMLRILLLYSSLMHSYVRCTHIFLPCSYSVLKHCALRLHTRHFVPRYLCVHRSQAHYYAIVLRTLSCIRCAHTIVLIVRYAHYYRACTLVFALLIPSCLHLFNSRKLELGYERPRAISCT
jgi:hypothetical protein